ncbi:MAG: PQQ-like beta-propeller repeat protein, partial [Planctomycetales bacterium]|nr:PQQ-like beta-propeller repeat protein [Planctomycetales bacterium]
AEKVFLLIDHEGPSYAMAVNKTNGETIWKTDRSGRMSWSSPSLLEIDGKPQLVASSAGSVDGYDPETGKQLWTYGDVGGNTAPTPIAAGKNQFLLGASPGPRGETRDQAARSNGLMRIEMQDGKPEAKLVWQAGKALSTFASPVVHQGFGYWVNQTGVVFCFDMQTGEEKYSERLAESCWATPVGIDDRIFFFGQKGNTTVIAAGPEHKQLAVNRLWEAEAAETNEGDRPSFGGRTQYGAVAVGDCLLVRTGDILYCVGK